MRPLAEPKRMLQEPERRLQRRQWHQRQVQRPALLPVMARHPTVPPPN